VLFFSDSLRTKANERVRSRPSCNAQLPQKGLAEFNDYWAGCLLLAQREPELDGGAGAGAGKRKSSAEQLKAAAAGKEADVADEKAGGSVAKRPGPAAKKGAAKRAAAARWNKGKDGAAAKGGVEAKVEETSDDEVCGSE
jgi:hypothetical protein